MDSLLLRDARLILPGRVLGRGGLLIKEGRIAQIFEGGAPDAGADQVIDLDGLTIFPGFIDLHIHGAIGVDVLDANSGDLAKVAEFLAQQGVTAWLPTVVPAPVEQYQQAVRAIDEVMAQPQDPVPRARVLGIHYEGPFVNTAQCGALHQEHFRTFKTAGDLDVLPALKGKGSSHLMTLAPEIDGGIELINELQRRNWVVSIGHTRASAEVLDRALSAGARHMTHFMNAMTPLHHRDLGAAGWGFIHNEVTCDVIADGVHLNREILKLIVGVKRAKNVSLISDAIAATGKGNGVYEIWGEKITVAEGRTQNSRGSIAGSVITMLEAVRMMLSLGLSEDAVAEMASLNPARLLGLDQECGSIEPGKRADLVALDKDLNVKLTLIDGRTTTA